jgi:hypothetical protein
LFKTSALLISSALMLFGAAPAIGSTPRAPQPLASVEVASLAKSNYLSINVTCKRSGEIAWNGSFQANANTTYNVYSMVSGGGLGEYDWQYMGVSSTGGLGIGSTNTYFYYVDSPTSATVEVKIAGMTTSKTVRCT